MAYIGRFSNNVAVRQTYFYTATGGETSLSGADDNGNTLVFTDGNYVDVYLNGVLLVKDTDYNVNTANTIASLAALSASDVVEIVVYDIFSVADTVSKSNGGRFDGDVIFGTTGATTLPVGTEAQRPTPAKGMLRFNDDTDGFEGYDGTAWGAVGGGNSTTVGWENAITIQENYTVTTGNNMMSAGPVTIDSGYTVTVPTGSRWVVV